MNEWMNALVCVRFIFASIHRQSSLVRIEVRNRPACAYRPACALPRPQPTLVMPLPLPLPCLALAVTTALAIVLVLALAVTTALPALALVLALPGGKYWLRLWSRRQRFIVTSVYC